MMEEHFLQQKSTYIKRMRCLKVIQRRILYIPQRKSTNTFGIQMKVLRCNMDMKQIYMTQLGILALQDGFDELSKNIEESYWLADGVHPTAMGHEYIKSEWIKAFKILEK